jgi:hypothetical protein
LNPELKKCPFSSEEDRILMDGWKMCGPRWNVIAKHLPGRTQTKIRDRFKTLRIRYKDEIDEWENKARNESEESNAENRTYNIPASPQDKVEIPPMKPEVPPLYPVMALYLPEVGVKPETENPPEVFKIKRVGSLDCLFDAESESCPSSPDDSNFPGCNLQAEGDATPTFADYGMDFDSMMSEPSMPSIW